LFGLLCLALPYSAQPCLTRYDGRRAQMTLFCNTAPKWHISGSPHAYAPQGLCFINKIQES